MKVNAFRNIGAAVVLLGGMGGASVAQAFIANGALGGPANSEDVWRLECPGGTATVVANAQDQGGGAEVLGVMLIRHFGSPEKVKADPSKPSHVGAPIPGVVASLAVELNETVNKGDRLLVMEAMKMQSTVYAPVSGKVTQRLVHAGESVEAKDLLLVIE